MAAHQPRRRPLPEGETFFTPGATGMRRRVEQRSAAPLVFLHGLPRWIVPLALLAVLIVGFTVPGWVGGVVLAAVAVFLGWFSYLSWPSLTVSARLLRAVTIAAVIAVAIVQFSR
ncbi:MAG TPA: DUF6703 family protein [Streptosporangiaceae bacterium]|nr:DUF6703 family protein [Streptosporangiaceae bacterium]